MRKSLFQLFSGGLYADQNISTDNVLDLYNLDHIRNYATKFKSKVILTRESLHNNKTSNRDCSLQVCYFCQGPKAMVKCYRKGCLRRFHYICGFESEKCLFKFDEVYPAFCPTHVPRVPAKMQPKDVEQCCICLNELGAPTLAGIISLNCRPYMWIHRNCAIRLAANKGYGFGCPICAEKTKFQRYIQLRGVFVPSVDILTQIHNAEVEATQTKYCEAEICLRTTSKERRVPEKLIADGDLVSCNTCGKVFHVECSTKQGISDQFQVFACSSCITLSEHELSVSSSSPSSQNSVLDRCFDMGSDVSANDVMDMDEEDADADAEEPAPKRFKCDTHVTFTPSKGCHNAEWRTYKLNLFLNSLKPPKKKEPFVFD